ncbi:hypothetical protein [Edwardsiella tarda]|uniref:hypothetical protein n=1 Tax=Edwardsiella tarda TaxID=636 RepID=UPI0003032BD8|nr:hypothetical protein [Edwardsiella tarda]
MSIFLNPHTARATTGADQRTQIIALSSVIAAGALLLDASAVLGVVGCLVLLLALMVAFTAGHLLTRWQPWPARYCLAIACYAFLLSAAGWLLLLIAWHGACDWLELVPGVVVAGLGLGIAWRNNEVEKKALEMMEYAVTFASIVVITLATLLTHHYAEVGRGGFVYALAVLVDLALLGGILVKVREQDLE